MGFCIGDDGEPEQWAKTIREGLKLTHFDMLDPWTLADVVPAHVFYIEDLVLSDDYSGLLNDNMKQGQMRIKVDSALG